MNLLLRWYRDIHNFLCLNARFNKDLPNQYILITNPSPPPTGHPPHSTVTHIYIYIYIYILYVMEGRIYIWHKMKDTLIRSLFQKKCFWFFALNHCITCLMPLEHVIYAHAILTRCFSLYPMFFSCVLIQYCTRIQNDGLNE